MALTRNQPFSVVDNDSPSCEESSQNLGNGQCSGLASTLTVRWSLKCLLAVKEGEVLQQGIEGSTQIDWEIALDKICAFTRSNLPAGHFNRSHLLFT